MDYLNENQEVYKEKRSSFLTVLCVLTFIGSGWGIIGAITSYTSAEETASAFSTLAPGERESVPDTVLSGESGAIDDEDSVLTDSTGVAGDSVVRDSGDSLENGPRRNPEFFEGKLQKSFLLLMNAENIRKNAIATLIAGLFTLGGAILMWNRRRTGFYLYIVGIIIGIIVPFYLYGNNLISVGFAAFSSFIGLLFIALYALNLKSMR